MPIHLDGEVVDAETARTFEVRPRSLRIMTGNAEPELRPQPVARLSLRLRHGSGLTAYGQGDLPGVQRSAFNVRGAAT